MDPYPLTKGLMCHGLTSITSSTSFRPGSTSIPYEFTSIKLCISPSLFKLHPTIFVVFSLRPLSKTFLINHKKPTFLCVLGGMEILNDLAKTAVSVGISVSFNVTVSETEEKKENPLVLVGPPGLRSLPPHRST